MCAFTRTSRTGKSRDSFLRRRGDERIPKKVESLIATKQPKSYEQAVELLADLRDLAARKDELGFRRHVETLRIAHGSKRALIARLDKAGL